jgi:hypothetical protein
MNFHFYVTTGITDIIPPSKYLQCSRKDYYIFIVRIKLERYNSYRNVSLDEGMTFMSYGHAVLGESIELYNEAVE